MGRSSESSTSFGPGPAVRLLPIVIVAAVFMLGFRIQIVVQDIAHTRTTTVKVEQATALAQAAAPAAPAAAPAPSPAPTGQAPAPGAPATPADAAAMPPAEGAGTAVTFDPSTLS